MSGSKKRPALSSEAELAALRKQLIDQMAVVAEKEADEISAAIAAQPEAGVLDLGSSSLSLDLLLGFWGLGGLDLLLCIHCRILSDLESFLVEAHRCRKVLLLHGGVGLLAFGLGGWVWFLLCREKKGW